MGSGDALAVGTSTGIAEAEADGSGCPGVGDVVTVGLAHALGLPGTGADVADATPLVGLALALGSGVGAAVEQDSLVGTGSGVAEVPVGVAEGALTDAEELGVADALEDAFWLA